MCTNLVGIISFGSFDFDFLLDDSNLYAAVIILNFFICCVSVACVVNMYSHELPLINSEDIHR